MKCPYCNKEMKENIKVVDFDRILVWECDCEGYKKAHDPENFNLTKVVKKKKKKVKDDVKVLRELTIDDIEE